MSLFKRTHVFPKGDGVILAKQAISKHMHKINFDVLSKFTNEWARKHFPFIFDLQSEESDVYYEEEIAEEKNTFFLDEVENIIDVIKDGRDAYFFEWVATFVEIWDERKAEAVPPPFILKKEFINEKIS